MASLSINQFDENTENMNQDETDVVLAVQNHDADDIIQNEDDGDLTELKARQFSNNASADALGVPIVTQLEQEQNIRKEEHAKTSESPSYKQKKLQTEQEASDQDGESYTESPDVTSQDDDTADESDYLESAGDERIACIEEEYIQRIAVLEQRHNELENVLERLTAAVECGLFQRRETNVEEDDEIECEEIEKTDKPAEQEEKTETKETTEPQVQSDTQETKEAQDSTDAEDTVVTTKTAGAKAKGTALEKGDLSRSLILDLFVEFQHKIRNFAEDLNGVLNCSEAAIRHARVVQEWATSVQLMFEQLKEERQKILNYIDGRERNMLIVKEQFIAELEEQGKTLKQLVEEMMSHNELKQQGEDYCKSKGETSSKRSTVEKIVDLLLQKRLEEDKSIILNLSKQSKISEMKLFIIHQQSCIQQLQEQNKELRAIIEGLMGPEDLEDEDPCDTDQSGTPASVTNSEQTPSLRESLLREGSPNFSLVSDVLYCDRGEYLPGNSTDGDVATVQAYGIGKACDEIQGGEEIVFDPLSVSYVRDQCQRAEESERLAHLEAMKQKDNDKGDEDKNADIDKSADEDADTKAPSGDEKESEEQQDEANEVPVNTSDVALDTKAEEIITNESPKLEEGNVKDNAAGDSADVTTAKAVTSEQSTDSECVKNES